MDFNKVIEESKELTFSMYNYRKPRSLEMQKIANELGGFACFSIDSQKDGIVIPFIADILQNKMYDAKLYFSLYAQAGLFTPSELQEANCLKVIPIYMTLDRIELYQSWIYTVRQNSVTFYMLEIDDEQGVIEAAEEGFFNLLLAAEDNPVGTILQDIKNSTGEDQFIKKNEFMDDYLISLNTLNKMLSKLSKQRPKPNHLKLVECGSN